MGGCKLGLRDQIPYPYRTFRVLYISLSLSYHDPLAFPKYTFVSISLLCALVSVLFPVLVFPFGYRNPKGFHFFEIVDAAFLNYRVTCDIFSKHRTARRARNTAPHVF
jgi:hypothetical protein